MEEFPENMGLVGFPVGSWVFLWFIHLYKFNDFRVIKLCYLCQLYKDKGRFIWLKEVSRTDWASWMKGTTFAGLKIGI